MIPLFRKTAIALAILNVASITYAGTVTGVFIGGDAVDLQPRNGDLDFLTVFPTGIQVFPSPSSVINVYGIHPSYNWDFRLFGGVNFCGGEDLTVSWLRFHTRDNKDFGTPNGFGSSVLTSQPRYLGTTFWRDISSYASFNLDEVYGEYAHTTHLGAWDLRFGGGVEWARLDSDLQIAGAIGAEGGFVPLGYLAESNMHGFGPRVAIDMIYKMPYNLSVFAKTNLVALIARRQIELNPTEINVTTPDFYFSNRHTIIPKMGIRLGAGYEYFFGGMGGEGAACQNASLGVEAGWQNDIYIHAIERPDGNNPPTSNYITKVSNFGVEGFFISAKLSTNWW